MMGLLLDCPTGDIVDDSGGGDSFGVEGITVAPLPLHQNGHTAVDIGG
jgi:hypothetical protein